MCGIFYKGAVFFRDTCYYFLVGTAVFSGGFIFTTVVISKLLNIDFKSINQAKTVETDSEEEEIDFEDEYKEELDAVTEWQETFTEDELTEFRENSVNLETPNGNVIMFYDYENCAFHYYSNSKTHTFKALETVARKFVLNYDCKALYHDMDKELKELKDNFEDKKAEHEKAEHEKAEHEKAESTANTEPENTEKNDKCGWNPFASFKNYKIETKENKKPEIKEKINKFKYIGRLDEYNIEKGKQEFVEIDYSSFKKKNE